MEYTNQLADWCLIDFAKSIIHNPQNYVFSEARRRYNDAPRRIIAQHKTDKLVAIWFTFCDEGCEVTKRVGSKFTTKFYDAKFKQYLSTKVLAYAHKL